MPTEEKRLGRKPKYPWDNWFARIKPNKKSKRPKLRLKRGREFKCMTHSMKVHFRQVAINRGLKVSIHQPENDTLEITLA